jgi:plasmid maintenance system antidote protein VapI
MRRRHSRLNITTTLMAKVVHIVRDTHGSDIVQGARSISAQVKAEP